MLHARERKVLDMLYVKRMSIEDVAKEWEIEPNYVEFIRDKAIRNLMYSYASDIFCKKAS